MPERRFRAGTLRSAPHGRRTRSPPLGKVQCPAWVAMRRARRSRPLRRRHRRASRSRSRRSRRGSTPPNAARRRPTSEHHLASSVPQHPAPIPRSGVLIGSNAGQFARIVGHQLSGTGGACQCDGSLSPVWAGITIVPSSPTTDRNARTTATALPTTHPSSDSEQCTITVEPDVTPAARSDVSTSACVTGWSTLRQRQPRRPAPVRRSPDGTSIATRSSSSATIRCDGRLPGHRDGGSCTARRRVRR